jgi:hypothetical protein
MLEGKSSTCAASNPSVGFKRRHVDHKPASHVMLCAPQKSSISCVASGHLGLACGLLQVFGGSGYVKAKHDFVEGSCPAKRFGN